MTDHPPEVETVEVMTPRHWLNQLAKRERNQLTWAAMWGVLAGVQTVLLVVGLAWLIDQLVIAGRSPWSLITPLAGLVAVVLLRSLFQALQEMCSAKASLRIRQYARQTLLDKISALGPVWLTRQQSGALATQSVEHIEALDGYFARFYPQLRIVVVLPLIILGVVVGLDYLVAVFLLLSAPLIPLFMALVGMGAERMNRDQFMAVSRLSAHFIDRVRGMTTLQLFGHTKAAQQDVWYATDHYRRLSMRTLRLAFLSSAVLEFFASVAIAVVAMYVGFGLLGYIDYGPSPQLTLFSGLAVLLLAPEFFQPLRTLSQHYHDRAAALGSAESLVAILNEPSRVASPSKPPTEVGVIVALEGVDIRYVERSTVLSRVNMTLRAGDVAVLTGESGSGKSSLLALMAGFMAPDRGECRIDTSIPIAWLDQSPCILQGSLADNLRMASPDADDARLIEALERAGLGDLLASLPHGLATTVGERGVGLSGGQAQRLALARVYLSHAQLILLDEPTASLDAETEGAVIRALLEWAKEGRTLVMATHHPAVVSVANRHFLCRSGQLVEVTP
ncbi:thiol reductant ABC exporter subunit CydD [Halomonas meridiana]|uniref:thiol reductant ABC exporter subunit CydD n=1 Tax=Vreelandella aquamarina TaxID=77097 RepID=UPI00273C11F3|nr:thiol reductant ABC exporter subunit CydD [Halomonas meridiana]MDP4558272.1 thiol reductant ABC exporter subunit CydD [Halomonas meridiana]